MLHASAFEDATEGPGSKICEIILWCYTACYCIWRCYRGSWIRTSLWNSPMPHTLWDRPIPHSNGLDFSLLFVIVLCTQHFPYPMKRARHLPYEYPYIPYETIPYPMKELGPYLMNIPTYPMKQSHTLWKSLHTIAIAFCDIPTNN